MCCGKIHKNRADFLAHLMLYFSFAANLGHSSILLLLCML
nr:MAG TPA: hypothetical protein [Bacteriophage sp.]